GGTPRQPGETRKGQDEDRSVDEETELLVEEEAGSPLRKHRQRDLGPRTIDAAWIEEAVEGFVVHGKARRRGRRQSQQDRHGAPVWPAGEDEEEQKNGQDGVAH